MRKSRPHSSSCMPPLTQAKAYTSPPLTPMTIPPLQRPHTPKPPFPRLQSNAFTPSKQRFYVMITE